MSMIDPEFAASLKSDHAGAINFKELLNPEQYEACTTTEGPVLIIAGAGTGKTNTLVKRVMYLVDVKGVDPERILLLTFTNKAAKEMLSRAKTALDDRCGNVKGCTYHSFCTEWLRRYSKLIGLDNNFVIYDTADSADAMNLIKEDLKISREEKFPGGRELVAILSASINKKLDVSYLLEHFYPEHLSKELGIKRIFEAYRAYKAEKNVMDYDDLIVQMNKLLKEHPEIARKVSDTYKYIMVDEYQDSNLIQLELLTLIRQFDNKNICVVGDEFQSIYGFRGANFRNIMDFPQQFAPCKTIVLFRNYRSNQEILDLSNAVMAGAKEKYDKKLQGLRHAGHKPYLVMTDSTEEEAALIKQAISDYHKKGVPYKDMAVIIHSSMDSALLEMMLMKSGDNDKSIPYRKYGGLKFMERKFIKDIFALLKLIINKQDEISWFRILQMLPGLGAAGARKVIADIQGAGCDISNPSIMLRHNKKKYSNALKALMEFLTDIESRDFHEQLEYIIDTYYPKLVTDAVYNRKIAPSEIKAQLYELKENMKQARVLTEIAVAYKTASTFIAELTLEAPERDEGTDMLTVTTVHSVKGLEYRVVFLMDCVDGTFPWYPHQKADTPEALKAAKEEMEEERRVFYVAITRAKEDLYLFVPEVKRIKGNYTSVGMSPFLSENGIWHEYCEVEDYRE